MSDAAPSTSARFQTFVTVLIAIVSTTIALAASGAAVVSGNAMEAQHNGVLAKINLERVEGGSRVQVARNRRAFNEYRFSRSLYQLTFDYIQQAEASGKAAQGTRLRQEAAGLLEESNLAFKFVKSGYLIADESGQYTGFDEETFRSDERQNAAIYQDLNYDDNFAEAEGARARALAMSGSLIVLFVALMFLTWAEITRSALRWVWLAAGVLIALGTATAYLLSGALGLMGRG